MFFILFHKAVAPTLVSTTYYIPLARIFLIFRTNLPLDNMQVWNGVGIDLSKNEVTSAL